MTFENPQGLWLLALGVPVLVFHFYRGRIRRIEVPTLLFWEQVLVEEERRTALKRLRHYASLLLNLLALAVLTSAVAEPSVPGLTRAPGRYALLLDSTPGMGAAGPDGRTRLAVALDAARAFVASLGRGDRVSIHDLAGPRAPFTSDLERAARALEAPPPAPRGDLRARVLASLAAGEDVTAVFFTDRPPEGVDDLLESGRLRVARVGAAIENSGWISGLAERRVGEKRVTLSLTLGNFSSTPTARSAALRFNGRELGQRAVEAGPDGRAPLEWPLDPSAFPGHGIEEGGLAEVALEPRDAFPLDDVAHFVVPPVGPPPVIVFHPGRPDPLLMRALDTLWEEGVVGRPFEGPVDRYVPGRGQLGEGQIVIFDRVAPPAPLGRGGFLILGAPGPGSVSGPAVTDWDLDAPPNRLVDYAGLTVRRSRILEGRPLLRAAEGTLATWSSRGGRAVVEFGFSLEESNLKVLWSFPIILRNFAEWASHRGLRSFPLSFAAGEALVPVQPLWMDEGQVTFEGPETLERVAVRRGWPEAAPRPGPGFVRAAGAGRAEWMAVNVLDAAESDLREPEARPAGAGLPAPAPWHARIPYAAVAVAAVLAILLLEWWLFHRGLI